MTNSQMILSQLREINEFAAETPSYQKTFRQNLELVNSAVDQLSYRNR